MMPPTTTIAAATARRLAASIRAAVDDGGRAWGALTPARRATTVMLGAMIVAGVGLRLWNIGAPPRFTFDEHHFVPNARHYLVGQPDVNDHPPLGKLFIAAGMLLFGDNPTGWRAASLILGLQTLVVAATLACALFGGRRAAWFGAAFFAGDGFFLAYSRTALLDGGLACLVLWSLLAAVVARTWRGVLASAVLVGLAASVKWSGGFALLPALVGVLALRRAPRRSAWLFLAVPVVHLALWLATFPLAGRAPDPRALAALVKDLLHRHIEIGHTQNALASPWYSWPLLYHPIVVKLADYGTRRRYASSAGNPLLFFSATSGVLVALAGAGAIAISARARVALRHRLSPSDARAVAILVTGWVALLAPWIVGRGSYTFMYHYLPSYGFALTLVAGIVARAERRFPRLVTAYVVVVLALVLFFAPVWAEFPIPETLANLRLIFLPWRP